MLRSGVQRTVYFIFSWLVISSSGLYGELFDAPLQSRLGIFTGSDSIFVEVEKFLPAAERAFISRSSDSVLQDSRTLAEFSWLYRVGGSVRGFYFEPNSRLIHNIRFDLGAGMSFLSSEAPDGFWGFLASAYYSNITPRISLALSAGHNILFGFRHSCKHDLDQARRLVIEQAMGIGYEQSLQRGSQHLLFQNPLIGVYAEYLLPSVLPGQPENDRMLRLIMQGEADLLHFNDMVRLFGFFYSGFALLPEASSTGSAVRFDTHFELGIHWETWSGYTAFRRISDPMIRNAGPGLMLLSFGIRLSS